MSTAVRKYLMCPSDIRALPPTDTYKLGNMHDTTYDKAMEQAKENFSQCEEYLLICTIEFKPDTQNQVACETLDEKFNVIQYKPIVFNANDQCYPISKGEWDEFLSDEDKLRAPMELWVVDKTKYTAPI